MTQLPVVDGATDCWNQIGVSGDTSCPELATVLHCRNCPVFASAGHDLLEREPPADYRREWTAVLAKEEETLPVGLQSVVIFRVADQWLALSSDVFREVTDIRPIHAVPHRTNKVFRGLVNVGGELALCASVHGLLDAESSVADDKSSSRRVFRRLMVIERAGERWTFIVDEIHGVHRYSNTDRADVPVTVAKTADSFTKGIIHWKDHNVGHLDEELLFAALERSLR